MKILNLFIGKIIHWQNLISTYSTLLTSDVILDITFSRSENLGTTPPLSTFPDSLTKLTTCLLMSKIFTDIEYRLCL